MPVINSRDSWPIITEEIQQKKGPLVRVEIAPGQFVKMYKSDVQNKSRHPESNKIAPGPAGNKDMEDLDIQDSVESEDLTVIPGVGKASERALNENGLFTLYQIYTSGEFGFLSENVNSKIQAWRESRDL